MIPRIVLGSLVLNEMEWLPRLYQQHRNWHGADLVRWVFVEAADRVYADTTPEAVTHSGLSVDGTTEFLEQLARKDSRIIHVKHGFCDHNDPSMGKVAARQKYLDLAESIEPKYLFVVDGDEFYSYKDQESIIHWMNRYDQFSAFTFKIRHPWRPPSIRHEPLFQREVVGGFWDMAHTHWWKWSPGLRYSSSHNCPETPGGSCLNRNMFPMHGVKMSPQMVHMAFSSSLKTRIAKHRYYEARGEGKNDHRQWYVESRRAYETWTPQHRSRLPRGAVIRTYDGPIPECFQPLVKEAAVQPESTGDQGQGTTKDQSQEQKQP